MSFFLGKKSTGQGLMVATSSVKTIAQLKAIAPIDCEFHSDLPFLTYKRYDAAVTDYGYVTHYTGYLYATNGGPTYSVAIAEFPQEFYDTYLDRQLIIIVNNSISLSSFAELKGLRNRLTSDVAYGQSWINWVPTPPNTNIPERTTVDTPSASFKYLVIPKEATTSNRNLDQPYRIPSVSVLVTNFKLDGTYISPAVNDYTQGIKVKNDSFFINGYDLFNLNYISNVSINSSDVGITTEQGTFYLSGGDNSGIGMQLLSIPNRTKLLKGNNILFDTLYGRRGHVSAGISNYHIANDPISYGQQFYWTSTLISSVNIGATDTTKVNVIIKVKTKGTNIRHNGVLVGTDSSSLPYYPSEGQSYGALSFCLDTSNYQLVGHEEYYILTGTGPTTALAIYIYRVYIRRIINGGKVELELFVQQNENYTNGSGNMELDVKAIMFV